MARLLARFVHLLHLLRVEFILAAVADSWLIIALGPRLEEPAHLNPALGAYPRPLVYLLGALIAAGLATYGLALNDLMDVRRDRTFSPRRPLPAGQVSLTAALTLALLGLIGAICAAVALGEGSAMLCGITAVAILFYNTTARFFPALGIITFALIRMLAMFVPNPELGFAWPVWLNFTYVVCCATLVYALIGKRPRLLGHHYPRICALWAFWTLALIGWMSWRQTLFADEAPYIWLGPLAAVGSFIIAVGYRLPRVMQTTLRQLREQLPHTLTGDGARHHYRADSVRARRAAGHEFARLAGLWLIVLNASWLFAAGLVGSGLAMVALFALTAGLGRALHWYREYDEHPPAYRVHPAPGG